MGLSEAVIRRIVTAVYSCKKNTPARLPGSHNLILLERDYHSLFNKYVQYYTIKMKQ